jgi:hypothetical protein
METVRAYNKAQLAEFIGMIPQTLNLRVNSDRPRWAMWKADVEDGKGKPRYFSQERADLLKREYEKEPK